VAIRFLNWRSSALYREVFTREVLTGEIFTEEVLCGEPVPPSGSLAQIRER
jgi:hypothetical protein